MDQDAACGGARTARTVTGRRPNHDAARGLAVVLGRGRVGQPPPVEDAPPQRHYLYEVPDTPAGPGRRRLVRSTLLTRRLDCLYW